MHFCGLRYTTHLRRWCRFLSLIRIRLLAVWVPSEIGVPSEVSISSGVRAPPNLRVLVKISASIRIPARIPAGNKGFPGTRVLSCIRVSPGVRISYWIDGCAIFALVARIAGIRRGILGFVVWIARTAWPELALPGLVCLPVGNSCRSFSKYRGGGFVRFPCRVFHGVVWPWGRLKTISTVRVWCSGTACWWTTIQHPILVHNTFFMQVEPSIQVLSGRHVCGILLIWGFLATFELFGWGAGNS